VLIFNRLNEFGQKPDHPKKDAITLFFSAAVVSNHECMPDSGDWLDTEEENCEVYKTKNYCTNNGQLGSGWEMSWGVFQDYKANGYHGFNCPECGCVEPAGNHVIIINSAVKTQKLTVDTVKSYDYFITTILKQK